MGKKYRSHRGDPENFRLLLDLLEPGFFANTEMLSESIQKKDNPLFLRRLKENLTDFEKAPLFPPREVETIKYYLSDDEIHLYNAVTEYVEKHFNKALEKEKRNVAFALTILQRRLASSARAIRKSLERRHNRLKELYEKGQILQDVSYEEDYLEDLEEKERWKKEEELLEKLTSSETLEELNDEIEKLRLSTTSSLLSGRRDVIVVSSVSCLYGIGNPDDFHSTTVLASFDADDSGR